MRIVHMILSTGFAGSERATAEMCNAQCPDHDVMLIIKRGHTDRRGVSIRQWVDPRVRVVEVNDWFPRTGIARALEEFAPDVIHAHLRRSTRMLSRIKPRAVTIVTLHMTVNGPHFADMDAIVCIARWQHGDIPRDYRGRVYDINLAYIPPTFNVPHKEEFDTNYMRQLYDTGRQMAQAGYQWQKYPPGYAAPLRAAKPAGN